jgi:DNA/RNA endonuclease YhcR with UshA esterase domain
LRIRTLLVLLLVLFAAAGAAGAPSNSASAVRQRASAVQWCAGAITWTQARSRIGRIVKVKARVAGSFYARSSNGRPTFVDLGRRYPNPGRFTLVIWGRNRMNFPTAPERMFAAGKTVCARGRVSVYRGVPEIEIVRWNAALRMLVG